jgi:hypothetical protein
MLVAKLIEDGHSLEAVLTYERAMQNRAEVVAALEEAIATPELQLEEEVVG